MNTSLLCIPASGPRPGWADRVRVQPVQSHLSIGKFISVLNSPGGCPQAHRTRTDGRSALFGKDRGNLDPHVPHAHTGLPGEQEELELLTSCWRRHAGLLKSVQLRPLSGRSPGAFGHDGLSSAYQGGSYFKCETPARSPAAPASLAPPAAEPSALHIAQAQPPAARAELEGRKLNSDAEPGAQAPLLARHNHARVLVPRAPSPRHARPLVSSFTAAH